MSETFSAATVIEVVHANEMQASLRRRMSESQRQDQGRMDSVRAGILGYTVQENYDRAQSELRAYIEYKTSYPAFQERCARYVEHCCELIQAIQTKRNFPGLASLSLSKQQELHEKVLEHFEDLKQNLKMIEKIERDNKLVDVRTTVWVVQAVCGVVFAILLALLIIDLRAGALTSTIYVSELLLDDASTWFIQHLPF